MREYIASIVEAMKRVYNSTFSWYFLHMLDDKDDAKPWVAYDDGPVLISIPSSVQDYCWETVSNPRTNTKFIESVAERIVSRTKKIQNAGGWPIWLTHWQSLWSNGLKTGLKVIDEAAKRVTEDLELEWKKCIDIAKITYELYHRRDLEGLNIDRVKRFLI
ncbi:MAG: hypothetical protein ACUVTL_09130 [Thermoproteota archaeon]